MSNSDQTNYWVLKSVSEEDQSYKSSNGYKDELSVKYVYDNNVANSKQLASGDIVVIVNKENVLGLAKVSRINQEKGTKEIRRCPIPECQSTNYEERKTKSPKFKCNRGHEFESPISETVAITQFEAYYNDAFIQPYARIKTALIRPYYPNNYNGNMSIQRIDEEFLKKYYSSELKKLQGYSNYLSATDALQYVTEPATQYTPDEKDERKRISREILVRRGQKSFRDNLRKIYGDKCMVTGCEILDILEAAHINPYRGEKDNHISNGLLLRADIHTLFDLDLLGIEPKTLKIHLNKNITKSSYEIFEGVYLRLDQEKLKVPSKTALELRWKMFTESNYEKI